jgi:predicted XRE-type DNA-binding protein
MRSKPKRVNTGTVTVGNVTARRTRKAESPRSRSKVRERQLMQMRQTAYELSMQFVAQEDIARALHVSRSRVSQLVNQMTDERRVLLNRTEQQWREQELLRTEHMQSKWAARAESDHKSAAVYLGLADRKDRLLGLNVSRHELGINGGALNGNQPESKGDLSKLSMEQLKVLESLEAIMHGVELPPDTAAPESKVIIYADTQAHSGLIAFLVARNLQPQYLDGRLVAVHVLDASAITAPSLIEDRSVVATVEQKEESLRDRILRLHREGLDTTAIALALSITRTEMMAALEGSQ